MCGSLPFRSAVVVSLRSLSVCHGPWWLVTAFFPSLSLFLPVPIFSWLHLLLRQGPWVCYLALPMVVRTLTVGPGLPLLPGYPSPSIRLWVYWFQWLLFSTRVPYLRNGVTPAGSRFVCPRLKQRFSVPVWVRYTGRFLVGPHASICGVSARPVPQGVLSGGPRCVSELRLSLAPSSVLPCPMLGFRVASMTLAAGLGLSWVPCPTSAGWGFCTSVGGLTCALQPLAPSYRVVLTVAEGRGRFLVLSIVLPWP